MQRPRWAEQAARALSDAGYRRGGAGHHHHLVCDSCGRLQPFTDPGLERAISRLSERVPLEVSVHDIVIHGACEGCSD